LGTPDEGRDAGCVLGLFAGCELGRFAGCVDGLFAGWFVGRVDGCAPPLGDFHWPP